MLVFLVVMVVILVMVIVVMMVVVAVAVAVVGCGLYYGQAISTTTSIGQAPYKQC